MNMGFGSPGQSQDHLEEELEQAEQSRRILELKRVKRARKTAATKTCHNLERLCGHEQRER